MKKIKIKTKESILLYTLLHFLVDGLCSLIIFSSLYNNDYNRCLTVFFIYNFLAFLSQAFLGLLIDKFNYPRFFLLISICFLILGVLTKNNYLVSAIFLGIGNSFFHISGGKYVTERSSNNIIYLGLFVSTGAIGLAIGQYFYSNLLLILFLGFIIFFSIILFISDDVNNIDNEITYQNNNKLKTFIVVILLIIVVIIRSFVGKIIVIDFNTNKYVFLIISCAVSLGKVLGGLLVKKLGIRITIISTMIISFICLLFFNNNFYLTILGIIAFNTTMPITLWYMNKLINKRQGFSFGLLAASLIPGYLLGMIAYDNTIKLVFIGILSIISILFILIIEVNDKNESYC